MIQYNFNLCDLLRDTIDIKGNCVLSAVNWPRVVTFYMLYLNFQPGKALYTTVRELVENGLDSAESIGEFPVIEVTM